MLLAALHATLLAATMVPQTIEQLTDRATLVVRATVESQESRLSPGPAGIYTFSELRVVETLKGEARPTVMLRQAGGRVGNQRVVLPGAARLTPGEQVLVFLACHSAEGTCSIVALAQGKFHLAGAGGATTATRDFREVEFVRGPALGEGPDSYAELARRVRAQVRAAP